MLLARAPASLPQACQKPCLSLPACRPACAGPRPARSPPGACHSTRPDSEPISADTVLAGCNRLCTGLLRRASRRAAAGNHAQSLRKSRNHTAHSCSRPKPAVGPPSPSQTAPRGCGLIVHHRAAGRLIKLLSKVTARRLQTTCRDCSVESQLHPTGGRDMPPFLAMVHAGSHRRHRGGLGATGAAGSGWKWATRFAGTLPSLLLGSQSQSPSQLQSQSPPPRRS